MIYEIIDALTSYYNKLGDEETLGRCLAYMKKYFSLDDVYILDRELDRRYCCRKCGKKLDSYHYKERYGDVVLDCVGYACHDCDIDFGNDTGE